MKKYKVTYERAGCIGADNCCKINPERWNLVADGKADLKDGVKKGEIIELIITEAEFPKMLEAAELCPVNVIHIEDLQTGKRLI